VTGRARVAVIGLGAMGLPMARRLAEAFDVAGFDPVAERAELGRSAGLDMAPSPAAAAAGASAVLVVTRDQAQTEAALFGPDGAAAALEPGAVVLLASTVGPDAARAVADRLPAAGVHLADAPVSGGPGRAGSGDLLIVVGADDAAYEAARPVLEQLAASVVRVGARVGDGQLMKVINQLLAGVHIAAAAEAVALARAVGLDPALAVSTLASGAAQSFMLTDRGPRMLQAYEGGAEVRSRVDIFVKDLGLVRQTADAAGVPAEVARAAEALFVRAVDAGLAAADDSSVVTLLSPATTGSA
jgi:3-hydroxyisobutyrate dehydrogenase